MEDKEVVVEGSELSVGVEMKWSALYDDDVFLCDEDDDGEKSLCYSDGDSNAESFYANDYPDEEESECSSYDSFQHVIRQRSASVSSFASSSDNCSY